MKEATSELNITVIVVIIVAMLSFFFFGILWPNIRSNIKHGINCDEAICESTSNGDGTVDCYPKGSFGDASKKIICTWKG